jgi:hypothetical protein
MQLLTAFGQPPNTLEYRFWIKNQATYQQQERRQTRFRVTQNILGLKLTWMCSFTTKSSTKEIVALV